MIPMPPSSTTAPYGRSCEDCKSAKCKCLLQPGSDRCERCVLKHSFPSMQVNSETDISLDATVWIGSVVQRQSKDGVLMASPVPRKLPELHGSRRSWISSWRRCNRKRPLLLPQQARTRCFQPPVFPKTMRTCLTMSRSSRRCQTATPQMSTRSRMNSQTLSSGRLQTSPLSMPESTSPCLRRTICNGFQSSTCNQTSRHSSSTQSVLSSG